MCSLVLFFGKPSSVWPLGDFQFSAFFFFSKEQSVKNMQGRNNFSNTIVSFGDSIQKKRDLDQPEAIWAKLKQPFTKICCPKVSFVTQLPFCQSAPGGVADEVLDFGGSFFACNS